MSFFVNKTTVYTNLFRKKTSKQFTRKKHEINFNFVLSVAISHLPIVELNCFEPSKQDQEILQISLISVCYVDLQFAPIYQEPCFDEIVDVRQLSMHRWLLKRNDFHIHHMEIPMNSGVVQPAFEEQRVKVSNQNGIGNWVAGDPIAHEVLEWLFQVLQLEVL